MSIPSWLNHRLAPEVLINTINYPNGFPYRQLNYIALLSLLEKKIKDEIKEPIYSFTSTATFRKEIFEKFNNFLEIFNFEKLIQDFSQQTEEIEETPSAWKKLICLDSYCYGNECSALYIQPTAPRKESSQIYWSFALITSDKRVLEEFRNLIKEFEVTKAEKGTVFTIAQTKDGYELRELGIAAKELIEENYTPEVVRQFKLAVKDLINNDPLGRLVLLVGEPGTGKSFAIRALLSAVGNKARFIIVPPSLITHIGDPQFTDFFLSQEKEDKGPMVLVLEDADSCLTVRMGDNMGHISSILNLTDGLIGSLLDFRVIATTNASRTEMDPALLRRGRLSAYLELEELKKDHARAIWNRLVESDEIDLPTDMEIRTLADVYSAANNYLERKENKSSEETVVPQKSKTRVTGFARRD